MLRTSAIAEITVPTSANAMKAPTTILKLGVFIHTNERQYLGAKVSAVRTAVTRGKLKRQGRFVGRRSDWKKAYVTLRAGEKLPDFLEGA